MTLKKAVIRGLIGIPIGVFINVTIMLMISLSFGRTVNYESAITEIPLLAFLVNYIISIIVGFTFAFGSAIFEVDKWSLTTQTFLHFILITGVFIPSAIIGGWTQPDIISILMYIGLFIILYILIWLIQYYYWKNRIKRINDKLKIMNTNNY